ncbi:resolvase [Clostridium novyi A str. 4570]|uniref:Resolvase n=2 Tax=Clostridium novyi TaxID=1542 RepID=A0AA89CT83_CLONO|nr:resolvase [Clostridium novyi A str. 4570]
MLPIAFLFRLIFLSFFVQFLTLLAVAEMERNTIIERTQAGKAIAKTKPGFKEDRPKKYTKEQIDHALNLLESNSYSYVERITCISKSTLIRAVRDKKYNLFYINIL